MALPPPGDWGEGRCCFLSEGRGCLMNICVPHILCWVGFPRYSQGPMAEHLGKGNAKGPVSVAQAGGEPLGLRKG